MKKMYYVKLISICCFLWLLIMPVKIHAASLPVVTYQAHVQNIGWQSCVKSNKTAGTTGKSKRLEALKINLKSGNTSMIKYRVHVAKSGWQGWKKSGAVAGTTGESRAIEAIQIKLTGSYAKKYDVYYKMYVANYGWLGWAKNGATAGSTGMGLRSEAIKIKIVKKGSSVAIGGKVSLTKPKLIYRAHCQKDGWKSTVKEGTTAGTTGARETLS